MVIENIIQHELQSINREIVKKRVCLKDLLEKPEIEERNRKIKLNRECLENIAKNCHLPLSQIFIPITFFIPAGSYEGYLTSSKDVEIVESLGMKMIKRGDKYWLPKYKIRALERNCSGVFQSIILP